MSKEEFIKILKNMNFKNVNYCKLCIENEEKKYLQIEFDDFEGIRKIDE